MPHRLDLQRKIVKNMSALGKPNEETRLPLSRDRVLEAAIGLADAAGVDSLSMRKLARALGVEAMSLYYYVRSKDDILDGILEKVMSEVEMPASDATWAVAIRSSAVSFHQELLRHPWAARLLMSAPRLSAWRLRYMDAFLGTLRKAGFSAEETDHAYHALDSHILGFTLWQAGMAEGLARVGSLPDLLRELPLEGYPYHAEHAEQHLKPRRRGEKGEFEFGLDLILEGLDRIRGAG
jgi:AcrR family transcriptional regulator